VIAGFAGNPACTEHHLKVLRDSRVNPDGVEIDAYALAPYFGHEVNGGADDVFDQLRTDLNERVVPKLEKHRRYVDAFGGIDLIAYEGGQHLLENAVVANRKADMYDLYGEYLDTMSRFFNGVFAHYVHVGVNPPRHMWGSLDYTGQDPDEAPKYRALLDYAQNMETMQ
jgi:hypothetical protein